MMNYGMGNYGMTGMNYGYAPAPKAVIKGNSTLTKEQRDLLVNNQAALLNLVVTEKDAAINNCNHIDPMNGESTIEDTGRVDAKGRHLLRCKLCKVEFPMLTIDDIIAAQDEFRNSVNTVKVLWSNIPPQLGQQFFKVLNFTNQISNIYKVAKSSYEKAQAAGSPIPQGGFNAFDMYSAITSGAYVNPAMMGGNMGFGAAMQPQVAQGAVNINGAMYVPANFQGAESVPGAMNFNGMIYVPEQAVAQMQTQTTNAFGAPVVSPAAGQASYAVAGTATAGIYDNVTGMQNPTTPAQPYGANVAPAAPATSDVKASTTTVNL